MIWEGYTYLFISVTSNCIVRHHRAPPCPRYIADRHYVDHFMDFADSVEARFVADQMSDNVVASYATLRCDTPRAGVVEHILQC